MFVKKIVLLFSCLLFLATPVIAYQYWDALLQLMGVKEQTVHVIQPMVKPRHTTMFYPNLQELIEGLQDQSLDESFAQLLDDKHYPAYIHPFNNRDGDVVRITESPCFLKVFQQFGELPKEQAIKEFGDSRERNRSSGVYETEWTYSHQLSQEFRGKNN